MTKPWTNKLWAPVIAGTLLMFSAASANAEIEFFTGPGALQPDENVLLSKGTTGLTVFGDTNQTSTSVSFQGLEQLTLPAAGQARIEAVDGGFQSLNFFLTNPLLVFEEVEFNIDSSVAGSATLTFFDQFGTSFINNVSLDAEGENFFSARGIEGQLISRVLIESDVDIADVQQVRLGPISEIPEPTAWALMVAGFGLIGWQVRRRKALDTVIA